VVAHIAVRVGDSQGEADGMEVTCRAGNILVKHSRKHLKDGHHKILMDIHHLSPGIYICQFKIDNTTLNRMVNLIKREI
jgi:hypothetical protein